MPLIKSGSKSAISTNIREMMRAGHPQNQAVAAALSTARKYKAGGGSINMESMMIRSASHNLHSVGMIHSSVPGRTDKLPMSVPAGAYVLPADIPSALGQGNSAAGGQILQKMFSSGPYGMAPMRGSGSPRQPRLNLKSSVRPPKFKADGGEAEGDSNVPIIAAGGEFLVHPDVVKDIGHGDITAGHKVLDKFVLDVRKNHVETLKNLPGPKQ